MVTHVCARSSHFSALPFNRPIWGRTRRRPGRTWSTAASLFNYTFCKRCLCSACLICLRFVWKSMEVMEVQVVRKPSLGHNCQITLYTSSTGLAWRGGEASISVLGRWRTMAACWEGGSGETTAFVLITEFIYLPRHHYHHSEETSDKFSRSTAAPPAAHSQLLPEERKDNGLLYLSRQLIIGHSYRKLDFSCLHNTLQH